MIPLSTAFWISASNTLFKIVVCADIDKLITPTPCSIAYSIPATTEDTLPRPALSMTLMDKTFALLF